MTPNLLATTSAPPPAPGIAILVPWGERLGGAEVMLASFLRRLEGSRLDPDVVFLQPGPFEREVAGLGLRTHVVPGVRLRRADQTALAIWRLGALLRRLRPELVLGWAPKTHLYAVPASLLVHPRPKLAWWQHGVTGGHWMDRAATRLPAAAVGCSSQSAATAQTGLRPRRETFVVHPGIEPAAGDRRPRSALRRALGLPADAFVVGAVGRLQPDKGQDILLRALADLRDRGRRLHGVIVGGEAFGLSPEYAASIPRLVGELGLEDRVTLTGQVPDVAPYLRALDVFVNPSAGESFGMAIVEAMLLGVPVVNTALGGPEEIIEPGISGVMLDRREPAAIADAIDALMGDEGGRARLAESGRRRAAGFTADAMAERLQERLIALAGGVG
jgi:glycosyltransferase involved in cell wall biosynthesis